MHISDVNEPITANTIYPDRIEASLCYSPPPFTSTQVYLRRLRRFFERNGIRIVCWKRKEIELAVDIDGTTLPLNFRFRCRGYNKPLYVYFSFNPVSFHNFEQGLNPTDSRDAEVPFVGANNWLRLDDDATPLDISHIAAVIISAVHEEVTSLVDSFYRNYSPIPVNYGMIHIQRFEACLDLAVGSAGDTIRLFAETFPCAFKRTRNRAFRSSEVVYGSDEAVQFVEGYYRRGVRAKLYEKTNHRIRAEVSFDKRALKDRKVETQVTGANGFADIYLHVANLAIPLFEMFLTPVRNDGDNMLGVSDIEAFAAIVSRTSPERAISTVNRLVNLGRITTASMPRARRQQLLDAGVIERIDRGLFRLVPRYQQAISNIQLALEQGGAA